MLVQSKHKLGENEKKENLNYNPIEFRKYTPSVKTVIQNKHINVNLNESEILYDDDIFVFGNLTNMSNLNMANIQLTVAFEDEIVLDSIQFGICNEDRNDIKESFTCKPYFNNTCYVNDIITENLTLIKEFSVNEEYIIWMRVVSSDNSKISYNKEYSKCILKQI